MAVCVLLFTSSCAKSSKALSVADEVQIYAAVIKHLYNTVDVHITRPNTGYIRNQTYDEPFEQGRDANSELISESIQKAVLSELGKIQHILQWADFDKQKNEIEQSVLSGNLFVIVIGNIYIQADDTVQVSGSMYFGGTGGGGNVFILDKLNGVWTIIGFGNVSWQS